MTISTIIIYVGYIAVPFWNLVCVCVCVTVCVSLRVCPGSYGFVYRIGAYHVLHTMYRTPCTAHHVLHTMYRIPCTYRCCPWPVRLRGRLLLKSTSAACPRTRTGTPCTGTSRTHNCILIDICIAVPYHAVLYFHTNNNNEL